MVSTTPVFRCMARFIMTTLLATALGAYAAVMGLIYLTQSSLLFLPDGKVSATPAQIGLAFSDVSVTTEDGERLHGWLVKAARARGTLLFFHGNAGNVSHRLESLRLFNRLGLDVFIVDYRGYGRSTGRPSEQGTYRDARAAWDWLVRERGESPRRIILFGRSLGAAVAVDLASEKRGAGLILESGFTSVPDLAAEIYPWLPVRLLSRFHYDSLSKIGRVGQPLLVLHSPDDEIVPYRHGRRLFEAASEPKRFQQMTGGHNDGFLRSGDGYLRGLKGFVDGLLETER